MSFPNNSMWMCNASGSLCNNGEIGNDISTHQKRRHNWFADTSEQELFFNKKQAIESVNNGVTSGAAITNNSIWNNASNYENTSNSQSGSQIFTPKPVQNLNLSDLNTENNCFEDQFGNDSSMYLSHRKVKVNEVSASENISTDFEGNSFYSGEKNQVLSNPFQYYNVTGGNTLSIGQTLDRGNYINPVSTGEQFEKVNSNLMNSFALNPLYNKATTETFNLSDYNVGETDLTSKNPIYMNENSTMLSIGENYKKGEETTISFGGYDIMLNQSSAQSSDQLNLVSATPSRADGGAKKNKEQKTKKGSSNNFPSNVKSLLSTGILDGIPVKYVSWSREKNLRGVVKGTGYLCSCQDCKLSKSVNAYEFERHAGCKTKHPNNHIYFENGKTIYAVVQELKNTPQEMLFEVIQNVAGSPVNQKNFHTWKASYQAAARELQRIYAKDETVILS